MLELMDHTFDGHEDSQTGDLRGGLGQLVDGRYGRDNFKATGFNGAVRGKGKVINASMLVFISKSQKHEDTTDTTQKALSDDVKRR